MEPRKIVVSVVAAVLVVGGAFALALSGRSQSEPEPTPAGPGIGEPTVVAPVDPGTTPTDSPTDPSADPDEHEPTSPQDVVNSGDGDADGYLPDSVWIDDPDAEAHHDDLHGDTDDTTTQWVPVVEAFATAFANTDRPHEQWHADIAQYLSPRLVAAYSDPATKDALQATTLDSVNPVYGGETAGRALVRFANHRMDMYVDVRPSDTAPGGWEIAVVEAP